MCVAPMTCTEAIVFCPGSSFRLFVIPNNCHMDFIYCTDFYVKRPYTLSRFPEYEYFIELQIRLLFYPALLDFVTFTGKKY